jgi:predicted amidohydrolase YtcJ
MSLILLADSIDAAPGVAESPDACAIEGGMIAWLGSRTDARAVRRAHDRLIDVGTARLYGAFTDHHIHLAWLGFHLDAPNVRDARDASEVLDTVARSAARQRSGWLHVHGWRPSVHVASRAALDAATRDVPTVLRALDGHSVWVNSAALRAAGIDAHRPEPPGGAIDRDPSGAPTGVLREQAIELVTDVEPRPATEAFTAAVRRAQERLLAEGIVRADVMEGADTVRALLHLQDVNELALRINIFAPFEHLSETRGICAEALQTRDAASTNARGAVRLAGTKSFVDGSLGSHTAAMYEPYADAPSDTGILRLDVQELCARLREAAHLGLTAAVHAIGDRAVGVLCEAMESCTLQDAPHVRIEHAQHIAPADLPRLVELCVSLSMQPLHAPLDAPLVAHSLGARPLLTHAWRSLSKAGLPLLFGSDAPVVPPSVVHALTIVSDEANPEHIACSDALRAFGSTPLEVGGPADIAAMSQERVELTLVGGEIAFAAEGVNA